MANLGMTFDPDQAPQDEYEDLPAGTFAMQIIGSEIKETQSGNGEGLNLQFEVIDGEFEHRQYWEWLNIKHQNPEAEKIAHTTLGKICRAAGLGPVQDSEELHGIPMMVTLKPRKNKQTGEIRNQASSFAPYQAAPANVQRMQNQTQHTHYQHPAQNGGPAANNGNQRRWGNRASA